MSKPDFDIKLTKKEKKTLEIYVKTGEMMEGWETLFQKFGAVGNYKEMMRVYMEKQYFET